MIQDLLGIKYPIFQGGMAKVATGTLLLQCRIVEDLELLVLEE